MKRIIRRALFVLVMVPMFPIAVVVQWVYVDYETLLSSVEVVWHDYVELWEST